MSMQTHKTVKKTILFDFGMDLWFVHIKLETDIQNKKKRNEVWVWKPYSL